MKIRLITSVVWDVPEEDKELAKAMLSGAEREAIHCAVTVAMNGGINVPHYPYKHSGPSRFSEKAIKAEVV